MTATRRDRIAARLTAGLAPVSLDILDESDRHAGHAGARPEGETHFRVTVVAEAFAGLSRLERHRLVQRLLAEELDAGLHALAIAARAPGEG
jgi:BolA protein